MSATRLRLLIVVSAVVYIAAATIDRRESVHEVELTCAGTRCQARVDGGDPLEIRADGPVPADRLGLYGFTPWTEPNPPQSFLGVSVASDLASVVPLEGDDAWTRGPAGRWSYLGRPGERSVAWVFGRHARDFTLRTRIADARDAGVMFRASGPTDGLVFVIRPYQNDAFFFRLEDGRPGPILAMTALSTLRTGREMLRLGGLLAEMVLLSCALLLVLRLLSWLAASGPAPRRTWRGPRVRRVRLALIGLMACATLAGVGVAVQGLGAVPHLADETAYVFQARVLASGHLWAASPVLPDFFLHEHVVLTGNRWYGKYPPLFPALLALGLLVGAPWLVNPLLAGLTVGATFLLGRELGGSRCGLLAGLLLASSPWFVIMSGTLMSHPGSALLVTVALHLWVSGLRRRRPARLAAAGLALGLAATGRPFTALLVGLALALHAGVRWVRATDRAGLTRMVVLAAICTLPGIAIYLGWNAALAGEPGNVALYASYNSADRLGFGADRGAGWLMTWGSWGHTPAKALRSVHQYLDDSSRYLFGWPGRLSFALVLAAFLYPRGRRDRWLLAAIPLALALGHTLYWATQHLGYGARYWFAAVPALAVLSALGLLGLTRQSRGAFVTTLTLLGLIGWNLTHQLPRRLAELPAYGGVTSALHDVARRGVFEDGIVFVGTEGLLYNDGFFMNDPSLTRGPIFARDLGSRNAELAARYPGRRTWRWSPGSSCPKPDRKR